MTTPEATLSDSPLMRSARACVHALVAVLPLLSIGAWVGSVPLSLPLADDVVLRLAALQVLTFVGLVAWAIAVARGLAAVRWIRVGWLGVAYVAWMAVSAILASSTAVGVLGEHGRQQGLLATVTYLAAFFLALQVVDSGARAKALAGTIALTGTALAAYGLLQAAGLDPITWSTPAFDQRMAFATLRNPDFLGGYLTLPLGVALGLFFAADARRDQALWGACAALLAAGVLATFVRGAWIGAFVAVAVFVVALVRSGRRPTQREWRWVLVAVALVAVIALGSMWSSGQDRNAIARVTSAFDTDSGSVGTRLLVWGSAIEAVRAGGLTGEGPDAFITAYTRTENPAVFQMAGSLVYADNAHNQPLHLAVTLGVVGALLFIAFAAVVFFASAPVAFVANRGRSRMVYSGIAAGLAGWCAYLMSGLEQTPASSMMWVAFGVLLVPVAGPARPVRGRTLGWALVATLLVAGVGLAGFGGVRVVAEAAYTEGRRDSVAPQVAVSLLKRATALVPWEPEYQRELATAYGRIVEAGPGAGLVISPPEALALGQEALDVATRLAPEDFRNPTARSALLAQAAIVMGKPYGDESRDAALEAIRLRPASPAGYNQLAYAESLRGDLEAGIDAATRAVAIWPGSIESNLTLALLLEEAGRTSEAEQQYRRSLELVSPGSARANAIEQAIEELMKRQSGSETETVPGE